MTNEKKIEVKFHLKPKVVFSRSSGVSKHQNCWYHMVWTVVEIIYHMQVFYWRKEYPTHANNKVETKEK